MELLLRGRHDTFSQEPRSRSYVLRREEEQVRSMELPLRGRHDTLSHKPRSRSYVLRREEE